MDFQHTLSETIAQNVTVALAEDIGDGDITAQLIDANTLALAKVITRESMTFCGKLWAERVFSSVDDTLRIKWLVEDGQLVEANRTLFEVSGNARSILTSERCALNFIQTLSATATVSAQYAKKVAHTSVKLLDTRKTIPGLRIAQKYAVKTGGCHNHRIGLYDAFLIKENHIISCGSIAAAISTARNVAPEKPVEIEVESLSELESALNAGADIIMLDNFSMTDLQQAVYLNQHRAKLEASGNVNDETLVPIAETGVDYISIGALTKHVRAIDLSMRFTLES